MPPIKDATKRPTNLGEIIPPATPTAQNIPPVPPNPAGDPGLAIGSLGPAPALWTDPYSSMRQWKRNGVSQQRFPVLPTKANPQLNAAARGVAKNTVSAATVAAINANPPSGGVTSVGLTMPSIFVSPVSGSPITSAGTLAPAFTSEPTNSFFAGPVSINGSAPLDVVSPGGNNGATNLPNPQTFSQSVTTRSANDLVLYYLRGGGSSFITTPGWTNVIAGEELFKTTAPQPGTVTATGSGNSVISLAGIMVGIANGAIRQSGNAGWSVFATTTQNLTFGSNVAAGSTILVFVGYATSATAAIPYIGISDTQNNIYLANTSSASKASLVGGSTNFVWAELFTTVTSAAGALTLTLTTPALYNPGGLNGNIHVVIVEVTNPLPPVFTPSFRDITFADLPGFVNGVLQPSVGGTGANLFGTGGPSQFLRQNSAGAAITVVQPDFSDLAGVALPTKYKNIALVSNGFPAEYAQVNNITATANIGATTLYAVPAAGAGLYRLSYYVIVNRVATTSSTLPDLQLTWTDQDNSAVQTFGPVDLPAGTGAGQSGANTLTTMYQGSVVISAKASTNILYQTGVTTAYASSGATTMQYSVRLKVEAL